MYKLIGADNQEYGPVSAEQLRQWVAEGRVNGQTRLLKDGESEWKLMGSFPEFASLIPPAPGQAAPAPVFSPSAPDPSAAVALVNGPAVALMIVAAICALAALGGIVTNLMGVGGAAFGQGGNEIPPELRRIIEATSGGVGVVLNLVGLAISGFIFFAATKMRKLESYGLVMAGTIVAMLPCLSPCCCVGLPVGIWVLVVLMKPEVKSAFR